MNDRECELLVQAVDRSKKGAMSFEEFADLMYAPLIDVGQGAEDAIKRHVKVVTGQILDMLVQQGPQLGKAFCEVDPDRNYEISKEEFASALTSACNHLSNQAIEFLWQAQFVEGSVDGKMRTDQKLSAVDRDYTRQVDEVQAETADQQIANCYTNQGQ